jgi:hypothetical protein
MYVAKMGISDDEIMTMGRWKSDSYKRYIRIDTIISELINIDLTDHIKTN